MYLALLLAPLDQIFPGDDTDIWTMLENAFSKWKLILTEEVADTLSRSMPTIIKASFDTIEESNPARKFYALNKYYHWLDIQV